ncbi:unnamed protein product [Dibothriocephalus latus]|uniref:Uncharacterized protein n=1 Tax=Dibothriocephalus latus TaxID=60516 RepID=A0A3P7P2Y7_DIBLA|nr:unnamed protein product [Dibothriocephalus latus]
MNLFLPAVSLYSNSPHEDDIFALETKQSMQRKDTLLDNMPIFAETGINGRKSGDSIGEHNVGSPSSAQYRLASRNRVTQPFAGDATITQRCSSPEETGSISSLVSSSAQLKRTDVAASPEDMYSRKENGPIIDAE